MLDAIKIDTSLGGNPRKMFYETLKEWKNNPHPNSPYNWETMLGVLKSPFLNRPDIATFVVEELNKKEKPQIEEDDNKGM